MDAFEEDSNPFDVDDNVERVSSDSSSQGKVYVSEPPSPAPYNAESIPEVGNLTRKKRKKEERSYAVPDTVLIGDRSKGEYENALDERQQQQGGFETPANEGTLTNFVEIGQARDKILSLKLDQVRTSHSFSSCLTLVSDIVLGFRDCVDLWDLHVC